MAPSDKGYNWLLSGSSAECTEYTDPVKYSTAGCTVSSQEKNERVSLSQSFSWGHGTARGLTRLAFYKGVCLLSSLLKEMDYTQVYWKVLNFKALGLGEWIACRHCRSNQSHFSCVAGDLPVSSTLQAPRCKKTHKGLLCPAEVLIHFISFTALLDSVRWEEGEKCMYVSEVKRIFL